MELVNITDTFETWRQKTNDLVTEVSSFSSTYALKNNTLLLDASAQSVNGVKTFENGIVLGVNGAVVTYNSQGGYVSFVNDIVVNGRNVTALKFNNTGSTLAINGLTYTFPSVNTNGYLYNTAGIISFASSDQMVNDALSAFAQNLTLTENVIPVGTIVPFKGAPTDMASLWLKCDGSTIPAGSVYDALRTALGTTTVPNLIGKSLIGKNGSNDLLGDINTATDNDEYLPVDFYIKAKPGNIGTFSLISSNGITLTPTGGSPGGTIGFGGGSIALKVGSEFSFNGGALQLASASIENSKLKNASSSAAVSTVALRNASGQLKAADIGPGDTDSTLVVNKKYADSLVDAKEHKFKGINAKGFASYNVQPYKGITCLDVDNNVFVYGRNTTDYGRRFGRYDGDAYGHALSGRRASPVDKVYCDTHNTYVLWEDGIVYSHGYNTNRKTGSTSASVTADYVNGPRLAFNGEAIQEVILSYDNDPGNSNAGSVYALTTSGELWAAGDNTYGQLGDGTTSDTSTVKIPFKTDVKGKVVTKAWLIGGNKTQTGYALTNDGQLWACGYGQYGQIGRFTPSTSSTPAAINSKWVPVLNAVYDRTIGAVTRSGTTYTKNSHGLSEYDKILSDNKYYTVNVVNTNQFKLCTDDSLGTNVSITLLSTDKVYTRVSGVKDVAPGGRGNETFAIIVFTSGTVKVIGRNKYGQLGVDGSNIYASTAISITNIASAYTGLDYCVHLVTNSGKLYAAGDNRYGLLGINSSDSSKSVFTIISSDDLSDSNLSNPSAYEVYRFFSVGGPGDRTSRFCIFKSGTDYKLAAWGSAKWDNLGTDSDADFHGKPQNVYIGKNKDVVQVTSCELNDDGAVATLILTQDEGHDYGNLYVCGYQYFNFNSYPNGARVPYFTQVKNV
jgi:hypothetical protein